METQGTEPVQVRHFRQILLWPLQLMAVREHATYEEPLALLESTQDQHPWREIQDEMTDDPGQFQERHYSEFVTFLPFVQRFVYGEGRGRDHPACESPMRVFRRSDVAEVRLCYSFNDPDDSLVFKVQHVDLYFFYGIDVVTLAVEIVAENLSLERAQDTLYRFGRSYPTQWQNGLRPNHCLAKVEWLSSAGEVLAVSDYERREKYLANVARFRAPRISAHWEWLLRPLVPHHSDEKGALRYRLVEYHRLPLMAFLAVDDPRHLTRGDFARLALAAAPGDPDSMPMAGHELQNFEQRYCCDRYWRPEAPGACGTRYLCSGDTLTVVGAADDPFLTHPEYGLIEQFRHQYFLLFLIAHFHKAALFMISDRLVDAINHLDVRHAPTVKRFKRKIRRIKEVFLGFSHRYWFHEISDQIQAKDLYRLCRESLDTDRIYDEVRDEIQDMDQYLDSDSLRRQANTVVRLTVVTFFGLIGTVATGFLGMNLLAEGESPWWRRLLFLGTVLALTTWLTFYTVIKSKRLSDLLDAVTNERLPARAKWQALLRVWARRGD